jgi:hypothetical protein
MDAPLDIEAATGKQIGASSKILYNNRPDGSFTAILDCWPERCADSTGEHCGAFYRLP